MCESFMAGKRYFEFKSKQGEAPPRSFASICSHRDESAEREDQFEDREITDESTEKKFGPPCGFSKSPTTYGQLQPAARGLGSARQAARPRT